MMLQDLNRKQTRFLDCLIAEKFMGWEPIEDPDTGLWWKVPQGDETRDAFGSADGPPCYSTNEQAAMIVLRKWDGDVNIRRQNKLWKVELFRPSEQWDAWAGIFPLAVCLVVLRTLGIDAEKELASQEPNTIPDAVFEEILDRHMKEHLPLWQSLGDS